MGSFVLYFLEEDRPVLDRTEFRGFGRTEPIVCVRGKLSRINSSYGTFQSTAGVEAVALLAVGTAASGNERLFAIEGKEKTVAASLDYAISKKPNWLSEMFGCDSDGEIYARRVFTRENPERKRPGPVRLSINRAIIKPTDISIYVNGKKVSDQTSLANLYSQLSGDSPRAVTPELEMDTKLWDDFIDSVDSELESSIKGFDLLSFPSYQSSLRSLFLNQGVRRLVPSSRFARLLVHLESMARSATVFGPSVNQPFNRPLTVASHVTSFAPMVAMEVMRRELKIPLVPLHHYPLAGHIVDEMLSTASTDFAFVPFASATRLLRQKPKSEYIPVLIVERTRVAVVRTLQANSAKRSQRGFRLALHCDTPSTSSLYFDHIKAVDGKRYRSAVPEHTRTGDIIEIVAQDPDVVGVVWQPFAQFAQINPLLQTTFSDQGFSYGTVVFARRDVISQNYLQPFADGLKFAFMHLLLAPQRRRMLLEELLLEPVKLRALMSLGGIHTSPVFSVFSSRYESQLVAGV